MNQPGIVSLRIEFTVDADPIAGRLHAANEEGRPFCGWIELTRAIELGLAAARSAQRPNPVVPVELRVTDQPN